MVQALFGVWQEAGAWERVRHLRCLGSVMPVEQGSINLKAFLKKMRWQGIAQEWDRCLVQCSWMSKGMPQNLCECAPLLLVIVFIIRVLESRQMAEEPLVAFKAGLQQMLTASIALAAHALDESINPRVCATVPANYQFQIKYRIGERILRKSIEILGKSIHIHRKPFNIH